PSAAGGRSLHFFLPPSRPAQKSNDSFHRRSAAERLRSKFPSPRKRGSRPRRRDGVRACRSPAVLKKDHCRGVLLNTRALLWKNEALSCGLPARSIAALHCHREGGRR